MAKIPGETGAHRVYKGTQERATAIGGSMLERGPNGRIYRYVPKYDHTIIEHNGNSSQPLPGNQLPSQQAKPENSMDNYIDEVLEKSGMTLPKTGPMPEQRPMDMGDGTVAVEATPEEIQRAQELGDDAGNGDGTGDGGEALLRALGIGGGVAATGVAGKLLYDYLRNNPKVGPAGEAPEGMQNVDAVQGDRVTQQAIAGPQAQQMITDQSQQMIDDGSVERQMIEGPQRQLPAPTPVDEMIDETMRTNVETSVPRPSNQSRFAPPNAAQVNPEIVAQIAQRMEAGDVRGAFRMMQEAGIEVDEDMLRQAAESSNTMKSLRQRASEMTGPSVRRAVNP